MSIDAEDRVDEYLRSLCAAAKKKKNCAYLPYLTKKEFRVSLCGFRNVVSRQNRVGGVGEEGSHDLQTG